ncbi:MAG: hypothetical protein MUE40_12885 [Anaerolineae bacterium]|nr:hypothetical protein [Anaerolineae bacterium]
MATKPTALIDTHRPVLQPAHFAYPWLTDDSPRHGDEAIAALAGDLYRSGVKNDIPMFLPPATLAQTLRLMWEAADRVDDSLAAALFYNISRQCYRLGI